MALNRLPTRRFWALLAGLCVLAVLSPTVFSMTYREPAHAVEDRDGDFEIRRYAPVLAAEVTTSGDRNTAIGAGFRLLADYIFGNNTKKQAIEMTAPVTQQRSEKIAMTVPVTQQAAGSDWIVRFIMPAAYTLETLPVPNDQRVRIVAVPEKRVAAVRFSGRSTDENLSQHRSELEAWMKSRGLKAAGEPTVAFYNPPWSLPFLRRNEYLIQLAD
jgi:effector-binding domain-containing protein